jgi:hypothetical protein
MGLLSRSPPHRCAGYQGKWVSGSSQASYTQTAYLKFIYWINPIIPDLTNLLLLPTLLLRYNRKHGAHPEDTLPNTSDKIGDMKMDHTPHQHEKVPPPPFRQLLRNFLIELAIYGLLLVGYFYIALRFLGEPLKNLFDQSLLVYAISGLILIVVQAVVLEFITSWLFDFLGLNRLTSK